MPFVRQFLLRPLWCIFNTTEINEHFYRGKRCRQYYDENLLSKHNEGEDDVKCSHPFLEGHKLLIRSLCQETLITQSVLSSDQISVLTLFFKTELIVSSFFLLIVAFFTSVCKKNQQWRNVTMKLEGVGVP